MLGPRKSKRRRGLDESSKQKQSKKPKNSAKTPEKEVEPDNLALKVFFNSLIMDKIIQHLPLRCLPNLRPTCKLWNNLMVPEYRARKSAAHPYFVNISKTSLDYVFATLNEATPLPLSAYKFFDVQMTSGKVQQLLDKIGGTMTHLQLDLNKLSLSIEDFRTLLFHQCPVLRSLDITDHANLSVVPSFWKSKLQIVGNEEEQMQKTLPHLKNISLGLRCNTTQNLVYPNSCFRLARDLLNAAINLANVKVNCFGSPARVLSGIILEILLKQQENGHLAKIQKIKFGERVSIQDLEDLVQLSTGNNRLELKKLDLRPFASDAIFLNPYGLTLMHEFLMLQASSLVKLTASLNTGDSNGHKYKVTLPAAMTALKCLKLQLEFSSPSPPIPIGHAAYAVPVDNGPTLPNIRFDSLISNFPVLQKLKLMRMDWMMYDSGDDERRIAYMDQLGSHARITELDVALHAEDSSYLVDYGTLFPNVKNLKVDCHTALYGEVWSVWPALEILTVRLLFHPEEAEIDSCITGIPSQTLKLWESSSSNSNKAKSKGKAKGQGQRNVIIKGKKEKELLELDWKEYKTSAGISDLHQLHGFNLVYVLGDNCTKSYVTDSCANYGFIPTANNYKKLRKIYIRRCSNFSPDVVAAIETSLGLYGDFVVM